jgi:uncharacterized protein
MPSSVKTVPGEFIVDSIHGDIHLTEREWKIIDTTSFQRLRHIKQLQMSQVTYPNATHTRFAHSIGTLGLMTKILDVTGGLGLKKTDQENIRMAALLHDIGHYPYSHLMEKIDSVKFIEEHISNVTGKKRLKKPVEYPSHTELGALIVQNQKDLIEAIGGKSKAKEIADLFTGSYAENPQLCKLITSSLDLDRLDYLVRDSWAAGVPFGRIDINYLLNNLKRSPQGMLGISEGALPAVEQFLLARFFMHRCVYYHKTTYGMEEACRQLLRRIRDKGKYGIATDGSEIEEITKSQERLSEFTDSYVDNIIKQAVADDDKIISSLASSIQKRKPPKLLKEVCIFHGIGEDNHKGKIFERNCKDRILELSKKVHLPIELFIFCSKSIRLEKDLIRHTVGELESISQTELEKERRDEDDIIRVFENGSKEPKSLLNIEHSIISKFANLSFTMYRLYVVYNKKDRIKVTNKLKEKVKDWDKL